MKVNDDIISCNKCGIVFNIEDWVVTLAQFGFYKLEEEKLSRKDVIYWNWMDLEQTEEEYYKFCPVCNSWEYHKKIKFKELKGGNNKK